MAQQDRATLKGYFSTGLKPTAAQFGDTIDSFALVGEASGGGTWGSITGTLADQADLQTVLDGKADSGHGHAISDITSLQATLDGKAAASHGHTFFDLTDVPDTGAEGQIPVIRSGVVAFEAKPVSSGSPAWGEITGTLTSQTDLQTALNGKAAATHGHTLADISDAGTAAASAIGDFAAAAHAHTLAEISDAGTAAAAATGDFATAAQGALADSAAQVYATTIGDGAATSIAVTHNLGTRDVTVQVYDATTFEAFIVDVVHTDANTVTLTFGTAPTAGQYRAVVAG